MSFLQWFKKSELNYIMFGMNCRTLMKSLSLQLILQSLSQTVFTVLKSNCFQARSHLLRDKCIAGDRESFIQRSGNRKRTYTANSFCCMWIIHLNYLSYPGFNLSFQGKYLKCYGSCLVMLVGIIVIMFRYFLWEVGLKGELYGKQK